MYNNYCKYFKTIPHEIKNRTERCPHYDGNEGANYELFIIHNSNGRFL